MVKSTTSSNSANESLKKYNRKYYLKNKERLLIYNKIYKTIQREKNLDSLQKYYDNITLLDKADWSKAMPKIKTTRVRNCKLKYDKGPTVKGFSRKQGQIVIDFS